MYHLHRCWGHTVLYSTYLWKSIQIHPKRESPVVRSSTLAARWVQHQPRVGLGPGQESPCPWPPAHFREPPLSTWDPGFPTQGTPVLLASLMEPLPLTHLPQSPVLWSVYFRPKNWQGCVQGVWMEHDVLAGVFALIHSKPWERGTELGCEAGRLGWGLRTGPSYPRTTRNPRNYNSNLVVKGIYQDGRVALAVQSPSCVQLCDPMGCSMPGLLVPHHLPEFAQVYAHWIGDAIQPSHPLTPSSPSALNLSQHQGLL